MNFIEVNKLSIKYDGGFFLNDISFSMEKGDILCIVGESGSGKSTLAKAMANIIEKCASVEGVINYNGVNILRKNQEEMRALRHIEIAICLQSSGDILNPMLTLKEQLYEILKRKYDGVQIGKIAKQLMCSVELDEEVLNMYKHQISGGMLQKFLIASTIALNPRVAIFDEPTSSLDYYSRKVIVNLIKEINKKQGTTFVIVTHDLSFALETAKKILVLYNGWAAEYGLIDKVMREPRHPYTKGLIGSSPEVNVLRDIWGIRPPDKTGNTFFIDSKNKNSINEINFAGCKFFSRCNQRINCCEYSNPHLKLQEDDDSGRYVACLRGGIVKILEGKNLSKSYGRKKVADSISLSLYSSEIIGILGVSGIGKTTLINMLCGFIKPDKGEIWFDGEKADFKKIRRIKGGLQMVLQDPTTSVNPEFTVLQAVTEPLIINYNGNHVKDATKALQQVGLPFDNHFITRKIAGLSGGEKQRVSIARALVMKPKVLIADEITSMLDTSNKANLLRLLKGLQYENGFSMIYVTHDVHSAMKISDRVLVYRSSNELVDIRELCSLPKLELENVYKCI